MGDDHVLERAHLPEDGRLLEGPDHPPPRHRVRRLAGDLLPGEPHPPRGRPQERGDELEQGALARPVRADDAEDPAFLDRERHLVDGGEAPEALGESLDLEEAHGRFSGRWSQRRQPVPQPAPAPAPAPGPAPAPPPGAAPARPPEAEQPVREPEHQPDHEQGVDEGLVLVEPVQELERDEEDEGPHQGAEHVAETPEEAVEHQVDGVLHLERGRVDALLHGEEERAAHPAQERADRERDDPKPRHVDPDGGGEVLVLLERPEEPAEPAVDDAVERGVGRDREKGGEAEEGDVGVHLREVRDQGEPEHLDRPREGDVQNPPGAVRHRRERLGAQARRLRQAQGHHREVDALQAGGSAIRSRRRRGP